MAKKQFDVRMQVLFCPKHKKNFQEKVVVKLTRDVGINAGELANLWRKTETCLDCKWKITFGKQSFFG